MEKVQVALMNFTNAVVTEMATMNNRIQKLEEELEDTRGKLKLDRKEAIAFMGVSVTTFQRYLKKGLPVHGSPKKQVFFKKEILEFLREIGKEN